jgi:hypothetical protein
MKEALTVVVHVAAWMTAVGIAAAEPATRCVLVDLHLRGSDAEERGAADALGLVMLFRPEWLG